MADTPRRKRKANPTAPAAPILMAKDTDQPVYANIIVNADEIHILISSLGAALAVNMSDDDDDPDVQAAVDGAMMFLDGTPANVVEALVDKLNRAHTHICKTAPDEFGDLST